MLEFIAFNVQGSCFLIKDDRKRILVDCGQRRWNHAIRQRIKNHLKETNYTIDLAICTHYDGFSELFKSTELIINEFWLPDGYWHDNCIPEDILCHFDSHRHPDLSYFAFTDEALSLSETNYDECYKIRALNSINVSSGCGYLAYNKPSENISSLVFFYNGKTGILLTGDSYLDSINDEELKRYICENTSLATIPHHGSNKNNELDNLLNLVSSNATFVQSYHSSVKPEICNKLSRTFCTCCCNEGNISQDINLRFNEDKWEFVGTTMQCYLQT